MTMGAPESVQGATAREREDDAELDGASVTGKGRGEREVVEVLIGILGALVRVGACELTDNGVSVVGSRGGACALEGDGGGAEADEVLHGGGGVAGADEGGGTGEDDAAAGVA